MHFADRVALVVLAGEQRAELELIECDARASSTSVSISGSERLVVFLAAELVQRLDVGDAPFELVDELDVVADRRDSPW